LLIISDTTTQTTETKARTNKTITNVVTTPESPLFIKILYLKDFIKIGDLIFI
jgi:hypothetical protein